LNEIYERRDRGSTHEPKGHAALKTALSWMRKIATLRGFRFYRVRAEKGIQVKRWGKPTPRGLGLAVPTP
jgi:hypothetical protein